MAIVLTYAKFEERYRDKKYIGAGGFGKVYRVFDSEKNHFVALKVSDVRPEWNKFTLKNEVDVVNKLSYHRNIARYYDCYRFNTGMTGEMDFAILQFYENGNLEQFLKKETLTDQDKRLIIRGILSGLSFLHKNHVVHRDLKAQNILMSREDGIWTPRITDFGLSREIEESATITNSAVGISYAYAAPEQILNQKIHRNVDIWAMGVIIYRIIADELPFSNRQGESEKSSDSQLEISKKIVANKLPEKLKTVEEPYQSIIKRCLVLDPMERAQSPDELIAMFKSSSVAQNKSTSEGDNHTDDLEDDKTILVTTVPNPIKKEDDMPRFPPPVDTVEYELPNNNQTQYISNKVAVQAPVPPPVVEKYTPKNNPEKKKSKAVWVIFPLLLIAAVSILWYFSENGSQTPSNKNSSENNEGFIPQNDTPVLENNFDRFEALESENDLGINDEATLQSISRELEAMLDNPKYSENYRVHFLMAKNQLYLGLPYRTVFSSLENSAEIAAKNKDGTDLLQDLENDKNDEFADISSFQDGKRWNRITDALK